ncbi:MULTISPECIES: hypothetical protein [Actinomyces]|uniref:hypothetical protein n=1 Tax=Actinomyces TaxID=1654 RepID=UPI000A6FB0A7|nr:hypothetical protein [Actinomyces oris]
MKIARFDIMTRGKVKVISKRIGRIFERLTHKSSIFVNSIAPKGWDEGVNVNKLHKLVKNPFRLIYPATFLLVVTIALMVLPYSLLVDPVTTEVVTAVLGFFSVVSLSSVLAPLGVVLSLLIVLRMTKVVAWRVDIKSVVFHLSNYVGIAGVIGFLSAATAPLVFSLGSSENEFSSSLMFDGSVLLKFPAAFGIIGLLLGLCTASCHVVKGVENVFYTSVAPVLLFDTLVAIFAFRFNVDPFNLCINLSERYLRDHSSLVAQMDSLSDAEIGDFIRDNLPLVAARAFSTLDLNSSSVRAWYVGAVVVVSAIGMCWNVWKVLHVKGGNEDSVNSIFTENEDSEVGGGDNFNHIKHEGEAPKCLR